MYKKTCTYVFFLSSYICICNIKNADFQAARVPTGLHGSPRVLTGLGKNGFFLFSPLENAFLRVKYTPKIGIFELPIRSRGRFQIVLRKIFGYHPVSFSLM